MARKAETMKPRVDGGCMPPATILLVAFLLVIARCS